MSAAAALIVDAHLHVWDLERSAYAWLTPAAGALHRSFTPEQAATALRTSGARSAVLVQAEDSVRDTELLLAVADEHDWVAGVVGWVDLEHPATAERQLDRWQASDVFCGVRTLVHDDPRAGVLALPPVRTSLSLLADRGLPFDVPDAFPRDLGDVADLARALPGLVVVVDHLGKPPQDPDRWQAWRRRLAAVAAQPGTTAKVSGLQVPGRRTTVADVRPAWETALELFGPDRLMWGSDWPMTTAAGGEAAQWQVVHELALELSPHERAALLGGTARRVYGSSARLRDPASGGRADRDRDVSGTPT